MKLSFSALANSATKTNEGIVLAIQKFLLEVGIELTPAFEADAYWDKLLGKQFQIALVGYTFAREWDE